MPDAPVPDLNPTPAPTPAPQPSNIIHDLLGLWSTLAGKRTVILSAVLAIVKLVLPFVPVGGQIYAVLSFIEQFVPVLIPVTLHAAIVNNSTTALAQSRPV